MHMLSETENKAIAISRELSLNKMRKLAKTLEKPQKFSNSHMGHSVTDQAALHHYVTKIVPIWLRGVPK